MGRAAKASAVRLWTDDVDASAAAFGEEAMATRNHKNPQKGNRTRRCPHLAKCERAGPQCVSVTFVGSKHALTPKESRE
jgi:hypothetical protein